MSILFAGLGVAIILIVLGDAFETIVLPRRVTRTISLARFFFNTPGYPGPRRFDRPFRVSDKRPT